MKWFLLLLFSFLTLFSCKNDKPNTVQYSKELDEFNLQNLNADLHLIISDSSCSETKLLNIADSILANYPDEYNAEINEKLAHAFYRKSKLLIAKHYFEQSASRYFSDSLYPKYAEELTNIGVINELLGDYPEALKKYYEAVTIFKKNNQTLKSSFVYNNLGIVYQKLKNKEKSIELYKKSAHISDSLHKHDISASRYNNIASVFEEFYNNPDSAFFYYSKALDEINQSTNQLNKPIILANIANIHIQNNQLEQVDTLLKQALNLLEEQKSSNGLNTINKFQTELLLKQKRYQEAEQLALKTVQEAKEQNFKEGELKGLNLLVISYEKQGKLKEALATLRKYNALNNEILGIEQRKEIEHLNVEYKVHEKNNRIKLLQLEKEVSEKKSKIFAIITLLTTLLLIAVYYISKLKHKHSTLLIKNMQRDISDYIKQIHDFEEEIHEKELSQHELFLQKVKQFNLTEREEEVLLYISKGYKNTEIAEKMFVSVNTVKTHIKNIFVKLDVRNRIEAANKVKSHL